MRYPTPSPPRAVPPGAVCRPPRRCARCAPGPARCRRGGRWGRGGAAGNGNKGAAGGGAWQGAAALTARPDPTRRDAEDAVYGRDGYDYDGYRLRVEFPRSGRGTGRGGGGGGGGGAPRGRYGPPSRRSEYRVIVSGESRLSPPGPSGAVRGGRCGAAFPYEASRGSGGAPDGVGCAWGGLLACRTVLPCRGMTLALRTPSSLQEKLVRLGFKAGCCFLSRAASKWKLAGFKGSHA